MARGCVLAAGRRAGPRRAGGKAKLEKILAAGHQMFSSRLAPGPRGGQRDLPARAPARRVPPCARSPRDNSLRPHRCLYDSGRRLNPMSDRLQHLQEVIGRHTAAH
ncbi:hypothetical protein GCM10009524_48360 [Spirilliplanes yamanashiensis]